MRHARSTGDPVRERMIEPDNVLAFSMLYYRRLVMPVRVGGISPVSSSFREFEIIETEIVEDVDSVEEFVTAALEDNCDLRRNRKKEREVDGLIQGQSGGTIVAFTDRTTGETSIAVVYEAVEKDDE